MKIKSIFSITIITTITIIIFFIRFWNLGGNPPSITNDEAALGYNAYSILKTGRDEYGNLIPFIFKSFGDYKPGLYIYLTVPFIFIFGLNEWSIRLPSAFAGIIALWLIYLIVKQFKNRNLLKIGKCPPRTEWFWGKLEIIAPFLLAISPWHLHFSRGAWEVNVALTLILAGIYFFLKSLNSKFYILHSAVFFTLSLLAYQGAKLSTSIVVVILAIVFWRNVKNWMFYERKYIFASLLLSVVITAPIIASIFSGQTGRLKVFSVFSYPRPADYLQNFLDQGDEKVGDLTYYLYHSEKLNFTRGVLGRYFNHFSGRFLFFEGDYSNPKHSSPNHGMLMLFDIILLPLGVVCLIRKRNNFSNFVFLWLILSPLPSVLSRDQVQAVRAFNMVIPLTMISGFGALFLWQKIYSLRFVTKIFNISIYYILYSIFFIPPFIYFLDSYFVHLPIHNARYWDYGYKQVMEYLIPNQNLYQKIYFQQSYSQPYIYFLFYKAKMDKNFNPSDYQKQFKLTNYLGPDVGLVDRIDNIEFRQWSWPYATGEKDALLIGSSVAISNEYNPLDYQMIKEIKFPDKYMTAFRIIKTI